MTLYHIFFKKTTKQWKLYSTYRSHLLFSTKRVSVRLKDLHCVKYTSDKEMFGVPSPVSSASSLVRRQLSRKRWLWQQTFTFLAYLGSKKESKYFVPTVQKFFCWNFLKVYS